MRKWIVQFDFCYEMVNCVGTENADKFSWQVFQFIWAGIYKNLYEPCISYHEPKTKRFKVHFPQDVFKRFKNNGRRGIASNNRFAQN